jgi:ABC-2 type transport system permease protein
MTPPPISVLPSRHPDLVGFMTLLRREVLRFVILPNQTLVPPIINAALYILVFGFALGTRIREVAGVPYILFIFPGLVMMGSVTGAYMNNSSSLFISRNEMFIQDLLVSPLSYWEMVLAYVLGGAFRGILVGSLTLATGWAFLGFHLHDPLAMTFFMVVSALMCAALGTIVGLWAEQWDHVAIWLNYAITPLVFLGGVFYSLDMLPPLWRTLNLLNPIYYLVNGFRHATIGVHEVGPLASAAVTLGIAAALFVWCVELFRRGWKLRA